MKSVLERPANFYEKDCCPRCSRKTLDYNPYHKWESCSVCGYMNKGVYK